MRSETATTGIVHRVEGGMADLAVHVGGCSGCGHQAGCGIGRLAGGGRTTRIRVPAPPGLCAGDTVELAMPTEALARAALQGYLVPAVLIVLGVVVGDLAAPGDAGAALGALAGLASGLACMRIVNVFGRRLGQLSIQTIRH